MTETFFENIDGKDLFEVMVEAIVSKACTVEEVIDKIHGYGIAHGESLQKSGLTQGVTNPSRSTTHSSSSVKRKYPSQTHPTTSHPTSLSSSSSYHNHNPSIGKKGLHHPQTSSLTTSNTSFTSSYPHDDFASSPTATTNNSSKRSRPSSNTTTSSSSQQWTMKPAIHPPKDYMGVVPTKETTTSSTFSKNAPSQHIRKYQAFLEIFGKVIILGNYETPEEAARVHDRALMRTVGPKHCSNEDLNFPLEDYSREPIQSFTHYDSILRSSLLGTSWKGPKLCDFSFLVLGK
eukprot:gene6227-6866_t